MSEMDVQTQLAKYVLWQHNNGTKRLSARQIGSPWSWIYSTEQVVVGGEMGTSYLLKGVKVPQDGEHPSHTFMLDQIRL